MNLLLFDGVCNLCNSTVLWVIKQDKNAKIRFAPLQSQVAQGYLKQYNFNLKTFNSLIFITDEGVYTESEGALRLAQQLGGSYRVLATIGLYFPTFLRDSVYRFVAKNRYKIWGVREACMLPTPELKSRFLA